MLDKKLTDNEIKSALKGAILNAKGYDSKVWSIEVYKLQNALDLINRQKAEIERLIGWQDLLKAEKHSLIKAEAYRECVEKVKEYIDTYEHLACEECECVPISKETLDNLLKEKVGGADG